MRQETESLDTLFDPFDIIQDNKTECGEWIREGKGAEEKAFNPS